MFQKYLLFFIVLFYFFSCKTDQKEKNDFDPTLQPAISTYQKKMYEAELSILDGDFERSNAIYKKSFDNKNAYLFATDLHNALRVSISVKDYDFASQLLVKLTLKGLDLEYFKTNFIDKELKEANFWLDFQNIKYPILRKGFLDTLDLKYQNELNSLLAEDQRYYCGIERAVSLEVDVTIQEEDLNAKLINLLKKSKGFPTEEMIGVNVQNNKLAPLAGLNVLMVHAMQNKSHKIDSILRASVYKGILKPETYIFWSDSITPYGTGRCQFSCINSKLYRQKYSSNIKEGIDNYRAAIGMYSLEESYQLLSKVTKEIREDFIILYPICVFSYTDKSSLKVLKDQYKLVAPECNHK